jgi:uncharacterized protein (DUF2384 family)
MPSEDKNVGADERPSIKEINILISWAVRLWGDDRDAADFLNRRHMLLNGKTPLEAAATRDGYERVKRILGAWSTAQRCDAMGFCYLAN